ncbi:hypothetical protein DIPPA_00557 [Diplonema papillatum]|nr:hypothetical protein DIPPA_00557 [Diplonema papillatum]
MNLRNGSSASARYHPYRCHPHVVSVPSEKSISYTIAKRAENQEDKRWDLVTNDGKVTSMDRTTNRRTMTCQVTIDNISPRFAGWDPSFHVYFNLKSTLSQLGINGVGDDIVFRPTEGKATVRVTLTAVTPIGILMLDEIGGGTELGKLFCREPKRRVADPNYLKSLVGRVDMQGRPVLNLGEEGIDWWSEMGDGRAIFHIRLRHGCVGYGGQVHGFLPTVGLALRKGKPCKKLLKLHQTFHHDRSRLAVPNQMLMVRTKTLFIRNCYARVASDLLPEGIQCCTSDLLEPAEGGSDEESFEGRTFCFFGESKTFLESIPFELYLLEPWRDHSYIEDGLQAALQDGQRIFRAFETIPDSHNQAGVFIVKPAQLDHLRSVDWIETHPEKQSYPGMMDPEAQRRSVWKYIRQQSCYGILKAISVGDINSHGVLFSRYLPSPVLKNLLMSDTVAACLKRIYFQKCSKSFGSFLSHEDRAMLYDLSIFGVDVLSVDVENERIFRYLHKEGRDHGAFVPVYPQDRSQEYLDATAFGVYGSNLKEGDLEGELEVLFEGLLAMRPNVNSPLLHDKKPLALITGGGPGAMEVGNRVAQKLGILSCGNICDFSPKTPGIVVNEQKRNKFVDVWMTYRLEKLVERQSDFQLDFPVFLTGGIGTDFEFSLEEVRRKVGTTPSQPVILFGTEQYFTDKITHRFERNLQEGVIKGSEWVSNCFYVVQTGKQALAVYRKWFEKKLITGREGPVYPMGFCLVPQDVSNWNP